jgi:hypothetical protein
MLHYRAALKRHAHLAGTSVTHECALEIREPSCLPMVAKPFFIPIVHSPSEAVDTWQHQSSPLRNAEPQTMGHVAAPELPSQEGRARSHGTHGGTGAHFGKEARSGATVHVVALEPTYVGRRGPELRDTWQRQRSPQQRGKVRGHGTCGGTRAHLCREVWSKAPTYVAARGCIHCSLS